MANLPQGVMGGFSGKVGNIVGCMRNGNFYIRSRPLISKNQSPTEKQAAQRARFSMAGKLIKVFNPLFKITWRDPFSNVLAVNLALSHIMKNVITGTAPDFQVDLSKLCVSRGDLPGAENANIKAEKNIITFTWTDNSGTGKATGKDAVVLVAYCKSKDHYISSIGQQTRSTGMQSLDCSVFAGCIVHTYISFISADGKDRSDSVYTGEVDL